MSLYTFPNHVNGDTFDGVQFSTTVNGSPLDLTSASIVMLVEDLNTNIEFSTTNGKLSIIDPSASGIFEFNKQVVGFNSYGSHNYEITFYLPNGDIKTYISGTWNIIRS